MDTKSLLAREGRLGLKWEARVSKLQATAILRAAGKQHGLTVEDLYGYVATGDASCCDAETYAKLAVIGKQAKAGLNASQAKRIWPRKTASVLLDEIAAR